MRSSRIAARASLVSLLICVLMPAAAVAYDPSVHWKTLEASGLRVHYSDGAYAQALQVARSAESSAEQLVRRLGWRPDGITDIVVSDEEDFAQGFALAVPRRVIGVNAVAPEDLSDLSHFDDWISLLIAHEMTHIVHIDTVVGLPAAFNSVFGPWLKPNGVQPRWFVEGLATYYESALTAAGRVRSPYFDMLMRMELLSADPVGLDEISGNGWRWPRGTLPYLVGGLFLDDVARRFGEEVFGEISRDYGGRLLPWAVNVSARRATGHTYPELYDAFIAHARTRALRTVREVEARGRRTGRALTDLGERIGPPRVVAGGGRDEVIVFVRESAGEHAALVSLSVDGGLRTVADLYPGAQLSVIPGTGWAAVAQLEVADTYRLYGDLFVVELDSGQMNRVTYGARLRGPDVDAQGQITFVQVSAGHSVVRIGRLAHIDGHWALEDIRTAADLGPGTNVYTPRLSPDGRWIAFSGIHDGQRDLYRVEVSEDGAVERLTAGRAHDGGPVFTPDQRGLLFHSDRAGVFDVFRLDLDSRQVRRVTRVVGGAFHPAPSLDGRTAVYRSYGRGGFDLARIDLEPSVELPLAEPDQREHAPLIQRAVHDVFPSRPYSAWQTLWPRVWLPVAGMDPGGSTFGATTHGGDVLGLHAYELDVRWGVGSGFLGFDAGYRNRQFHPGLLALVGRSLEYAAVPLQSDGAGADVEEEVWSGLLSMSWPLWSRRELAATLHTGWELQARSGRPQAGAATLAPDPGRFAALRAGVSFSSVRRYPDSISAEEGARLDGSVRLESPWVGSEYEAISVTAGWRVYFENPWLSRQVLAWRVAGGYGQRSYETRRLFSIGGLPTRDFVLDFINGGSSRLVALRGFPLKPFAGDSLVSTSLEYRLPIWDAQQGYQTLPLFIGALHGALFFDGAAIADAPRDLPDGTHASAGVELRAELIIADNMATTLRLGYGHGLGRDDDAGYYLTLGEVF